MLECKAWECDLCKRDGWMFLFILFYFILIMGPVTGFGLIKILFYTTCYFRHSGNKPIFIVSFFFIPVENFAKTRQTASELFTYIFIFRTHFGKFLFLATFSFIFILIVLSLSLLWFPVSCFDYVPMWNLNPVAPLSSVYAQYLDVSSSEIIEKNLYKICIIFCCRKPEVMGAMAKFSKHESLSAVKKDK